MLWNLKLQTLRNNFMKKLFSSWKKIIIGFTLLLTLSASVYALSVVTEGWKVGKSKTVKIDLVANYGSWNCKNVSSSTYDIFVPTANITEWNAFKNNAPNNNIGVSLANCSGGVVNWVCSSTAGACSTGSVSGDNGNTLPGGTRLWNCLGSGGGTNASCSYTNPPASCVPNGTYTYGACSVSCGGGSQDRYDSCGNYYDTINTNCNSTPCSTPPSNCTSPWWATVTHGGNIIAYKNPTERYWSSCVSEWRSCNNGVLDGSYNNQNCTVDPAPSYTYTLTWSAWSDCSGMSCPGTQSRTPTCRRDQDNQIVDASTYCGVQNSDLTQTCTWNQKDTLPACALPPSNKYVCANDTAVCTSGGWVSLWDGSCKNRNEDLCAAP